MQKKKLSLGIELDPHLKKAITKNIKEYRDFPVRWHAPESYHIPLLQIGWVNEDNITQLIEDVHAFALDHPVCDVMLEEITLTYKKDHDTPQHVRIIGAPSEDLRNLYVGLMDVLDIGHGAIQTFMPYVALGHVRAKLWSELPVKPAIQKNFSVLADVIAITLFEESRDEENKVFQPVEVFPLQ